MLLSNRCLVRGNDCNLLNIRMYIINWYKTNLNLWVLPIGLCAFVAEHLFFRTHIFSFFLHFFVCRNGIDHHRSFVECMKSHFSWASSCSFVLWHCNVCTNLCDIAFGLTRNPSEKWSATYSQLGNEKSKREREKKNGPTEANCEVKSSHG